MSTVLLVDDDHENRWALQVALESGGHRVEQARDGADALRVLQHRVPQLVITDWQMPEMDGMELCRRLKCQPSFAELPVILLSAKPEPANETPCWSAFFQKPADLNALIRTVNAFVAARLTAAYARQSAPNHMTSRWRPVDPRCWP